MAAAGVITAALMVPVVAAAPYAPAVPPLPTMPTVTLDVDLAAWSDLPIIGQLFDTPDGLSGLFPGLDLLLSETGISNTLRGLPFGLGDFWGSLLVGVGAQPYLDFVSAFPLIGPLLETITETIIALPITGPVIEDFLADLPVSDWETMLEGLPLIGGFFDF
jgi:hypothetical protein